MNIQITISPFLFLFSSQDMFFTYIWNNFLHIQVEICTAMILAMPPAPTDIQSDTEQEHVRESVLIRHVSEILKRKREQWWSGSLTLNVKILLLEINMSLSYKYVLINVHVSDKWI